MTDGVNKDFQVKFRADGTMTGAMLDVGNIWEKCEGTWEALDSRTIVTKFGDKKIEGSYNYKKQRVII